MYKCWPWSYASHYQLIFASITVDSNSLTKTFNVICHLQASRQTFVSSNSSSSSSRGGTGDLKEALKRDTSQLEDSLSKWTEHANVLGTTWWRIFRKRSGKTRGNVVKQKSKLAVEPPDWKASWTVALGTYLTVSSETHRKKAPLLALTWGHPLAEVIKSQHLEPSRSACLQSPGLLQLYLTSNVWTPGFKRSRLALCSVSMELCNARCPSPCQLLETSDHSVLWATATYQLCSLRKVSQIS